MYSFSQLATVIGVNFPGCGFSKSLICSTANVIVLLTILGGIMIINYGYMIDVFRNHEVKKDCKFLKGRSFLKNRMVSCKLRPT